MTGTRRRNAFVFFGISGVYWKRFFPVLPVTVLKSHRDRRADCLSVPNSGKDVGRIALDLHASAATKTLLASPEFTIDEFLSDRQAGGQSRDEGDKGLAVRLSGGEIAKHGEQAL